jgi:hypothetical protein
MDERLQFVARRLAGEAMAELCREFGISRKTQDLRSLPGIAASRGSPIEVDVRIGTRISSPSRWKTTF